MENQFNKSVSIPELMGVVRRKKWVVIACLLSTLVPVLIYNYLAVPVYQSSTKLIFEDTGKMTDFSPMIGVTKSNLIANQIEEMKTKSFAQDVYKQLPEEEKKRFLSLSSYKKEYDPEGFIVGQIKSNLSFVPVRGTEVVVVSFDSEIPHLAEFVTKTAALVLTKRDLSVRRKKYSSITSFIDKQFEIVSKRLKESEDTLKNYKESQNITSLEAESKEILTRITQAEVLYNEVRTSKKELQEKLKAIDTKLTAEKKGLSKNVLKINSPLAIQLKERLVKLEITYSNFQVQGYPEDNPKMVDLKNEIEQVKKSLINETVKINNDKNIGSLVDPFSQIAKFIEDKIASEIELKAIEAKEKNLQAVLANYNKKLGNLPDKEMKLVRLLRDKEVNNKLYMTLLEEREKSRINEASEIGNIRILEPARMPHRPIRPRKVLNLFVGIFSGLFLGVFLVFVLEYMNDEIRTQDDLERELSIPVIAVIPKLKCDLQKLLESSGNGQMFSDENSSMLFDAYSLLSFALDKREHHSSTIMITSAVPNEGKSTIASMLALTNAQRGKKTLLIDADLRKPSLHSMFGVTREPGITNLTLEFMQKVKTMETYEGNNHDETIDFIQEKNSHVKQMNAQMIRTALLEGIFHTFEKNLLFLPCGFIPSNPVRIWSSTIWGKIIPHLKQLADIIIFDAPPIIGVAETTMMTNYIDHVLFCASVGGLDKKTLKRSFQLFRDTITNPDEKIIGAVLNKADMEMIYGSYKYYSYYTKSRKFRHEPEIPKSDFST